MQYQYVLSDESDSGLLKGLKEKIVEKLDKAGEIKDSITDKVSDIKDKGGEHLSTIKEHGSDQLENVKSEAEDLKRIFQSKELIYRKSDAMAIVLRKLGNTDGFLDVVEQLTKEGYRLVHQENVRDIPIFAGFKYSFGSFYYFQHVKYIGKS
jgi:hypothetical protein